MFRVLLIATLLLASSAIAQKLSPAEQKLYDKALAAQAAGDFAEAIAGYRKVLHTRETYVPAHLNLASAYLATNDVPRAEYHLRRAMALQPENGQVLLKVALVYAQAGNAKEAERAFARVPKDLHSSPRYFYVRGTIKVARGEAQGALADLQTAQRKAPNDVEIITLLAALQIHLGKHKEAVALLSGGAQRNPKEPLLWQGLAQAYMGTGEAPKAAEALEKARRLLPDSIEIAVSLSRVYEQMDRIADAVNVLVYVGIGGHGLDGENKLDEIRRE